VDINKNLYIAHKIVDVYVYCTTMNKLLV